jgi:hypothetical protein
LKIYKASDKETDERLELDKRKSSRGFGVCFDSLEEAPGGFYKAQDEIRNGLQKEFWLAFDNGAEHLRYKPIQSPAIAEPVNMTLTTQPGDDECPAS